MDADRLRHQDRGGGDRAELTAAGAVLFEAANIISIKDRDATLANLFSDDNASTLLFLPLAHVFARMIQVAVVMARGTLGHTLRLRAPRLVLGFWEQTVAAAPRAP